MRVAGRRRRAAALSILETRLTAHDAVAVVLTLGWSGVLLPLGATLGPLWKHACNTGTLTSLAACDFSRALDLFPRVLVPRVLAAFCDMGSQVTPFEHGILRTQALIVDIRQRCGCLPF